MSSNDRALEFLGRVASAGDGAFSGIALGFVAIRAFQSYFFNSSALTSIRQAPNVRVSDLRQILEKEETNSNNSDAEDVGKLVVVRGIVEAKGSIDGWINLRPNALVSNEAGERAVIVQNTQTCIYNEWKGLLGWTSDIRSVFLRSWKEPKSTSIRMVPFVLLDTGRSSTSDYLFVNMDDSKHPLPLSTVYHKLQPIQATPYTFLQAIFGHAYPVGLLDEEKVLSIGKQISAVGICSHKDGVPQIKSSQALPYFLTEMTKDQLVVNLAFKTTCVFWGGLILGSLSIGILGYAAMRNWGKWKAWRRRRQNERIMEAENAAAAAAAAAEEDTESLVDELVGEIPDGELCVVCLMRRRKAAFVPCGHMVCCARCALAVRRESSPKCPVCRQEIEHSIVIYAS